jgi:Ni/Fe-hydrogenase subunit HybB-like protein
MRIYLAVNFVFTLSLYLALYAAVPYLSNIVYGLLCIYLIALSYYASELLNISLTQNKGEGEEKESDAYMQKRAKMLYSIGTANLKYRWLKESSTALISLVQLGGILYAGNFAIPIFILLTFNVAAGFVFKGIAMEFTLKYNKALAEREDK